MYKYLHEMLTEEKEIFKLNSEKYREEQINFMKDSHKIYKRLSSTPALANYAMAIAIKSLVSLDIRINPENTITLKGPDPLWIRYLWTAFVLLGNNIPERFNEKSIRVWNREFNPHAELGYFSQFGYKSLYETHFKIHLDKVRIKQFLIEAWLLVKQETQSRQSPELKQHILSTPATPEEKTILPETKQVDKMSEREDHDFLRSKYPPVDFVIYPYDRPKYFNPLVSAREIDEFGKITYRHYQSSAQQVLYKTREWHLNYNEHDSPSLFLHGASGRVKLKEIDSFIEKDLKHYANTLCRLKYEDGYLFRGFSMSSDVPRFNEKAIGCDGEPIHIDSLPQSYYYGDFPMDGVLIKISWFFESICRYQYTPGLKDCIWLEGANKDYSEFFKIEENRKRNKAIEQAKAESIKQEKERVAAEAQRIESQRIAEIRRKKEEEYRIVGLNKQLHQLFDEFPSTIKIQSLLEQKASINYQDEKGFTALMRAAGAADDTCAEYLLTMGANPLLENKEHKKAGSFVGKKSLNYPMYKGHELIYAVNTGELCEVEKVCKDVELKNFIDFQTYNNGQTALSIAVERNQAHIASYLLSKGANPTLEDFEGRTPLSISVKNKDKDILCCLLSHAVENNQIEIVNYLLSYGADPNLQDPQSRKPFDLITEATDPSIIEMLYNPAPSQRIDLITDATDQSIMSRPSQRCRAT